MLQYPLLDIKGNQIAGGGPQMRPPNRGPMPHKDGAIKTSSCPEASGLNFADPRQMISVRQNLVIFPWGQGVQFKMLDVTNILPQ